MSDSDKPTDECPSNERKSSTGLRIHNNVSGLRKMSHLGRDNEDLSLALERLSTGLKINRGDSADDLPHANHVDKLV